MKRTLRLALDGESRGGLTVLPPEDGEGEPRMQVDMDHAVADAAVAYLQSAAQEVHHTEVDWQVQMGYRKIKELDEILRQKQQVELAVKSSPSSHLNSRMGRSEMSYDEEIETKSVHSVDVNTFVTDPPWIRKKKSLPMKPSTVIQQEGVHLKGYNRGDFIQRNIALGPNARYYDAMTEAEEMRVRSILEDDEEKEPEEPETPAEVFIPRVLSSASPEDQLRLEEIDRKLKQLSDTPFNSLVTTPLTRSQSSASKDVDIILSSRIEFENPHLTRDPEVIQKLHDIDAKLAQLKEDDHKLASEAEIRRLLTECIMADRSFID